MAIRVVVETPVKAYYTAISGKMSGSASSTKAELRELLTGIFVSPRNRLTTIYMDNRAVITQFRTLVLRRKDSTTRQRLRSPYAVWWAAIRNAYVKQGSMVRVAWVRGHAGNE
ncbi:hypothetical protein BGZ98_008071, partial [Dissophora globulifera]